MYREWSRRRMVVDEVTLVVYASVGRVSDRTKPGLFWSLAGWVCVLFGLVEVLCVNGDRRVGAGVVLVWLVGVLVIAEIVSVLFWFGWFSS